MVSLYCQYCSYIIIVDVVEYLGIFMFWVGGCYIIDFEGYISKCIVLFVCFVFFVDLENVQCVFIVYGKWLVDQCLDCGKVLF